mgnify:CR=1 FL=1
MNGHPPLTDPPFPDRIRPHHLDRLAVVYVRQSTQPQAPHMRRQHGQDGKHNEHHLARAREIPADQRQSLRHNQHQALDFLLVDLALLQLYPSYSA